MKEDLFFISLFQILTFLQKLIVLSPARPLLSATITTENGSLLFNYQLDVTEKETHFCCRSHRGE